MPCRDLFRLARNEGKSSTTRTFLLSTCGLLLGRKKQLREVTRKPGRSGEVRSCWVRLPSQFSLNNLYAQVCILFIYASFMIYTVRYISILSLVVLLFGFKNIVCCLPTRSSFRRPLCRDWKKLLSAGEARKPADGDTVCEV
jgi:hypothetical protein